VEDARDLGDSIDYAVEDDVARSRHRTKPRPDFVARTSCERVVFQHVDSRADLAHDRVGNLASGSFGIVGPDIGKVGFSLGRPTGPALGPAMVPVHLFDELADVERLAFAFVQGAQAGIDVGAQPPKLLDVIEKLPADFFLVGVRKPFKLGDGSL
jgi:hypothetical protein